MVLDRFEENKAIIELDDGSHIVVDAEIVNAKEGEQLILLEDGSYTTNTDETDKKRQEILKLQKVCGNRSE